MKFFIFIFVFIFSFCAEIRAHTRESSQQAIISELEHTDDEVMKLEQMEKKNLEQIKENDKKQNQNNKRSNKKNKDLPSEYGLTFSFKNKNQSRFTQTKEMAEYLIIPFSRLYCKKSSILLATSPTRGNQINSISEGEELCDQNSECSFLTFEYNKEGSDITGQSNLCSGDEWLNLNSKNRWYTAVKPSAIEALTPNYHIRTNRKSICDSSNLIEKSEGDILPSFVAEKCDSNPSCKYFTIKFTTLNKIKNLPMIKEVYYCSGSPVYVNEEGWVTGDRLSLKKILYNKTTNIESPGSPYAEEMELPENPNDFAPKRTTEDGIMRGSISKPSYPSNEEEKLIPPTRVK